MRVAARMLGRLGVALVWRMCGLRMQALQRAVQASGQPWDEALRLTGGVRSQEAGSLEVGAGVRGRLAGPLSGQAYELGGRRVQLAPEADGSAWARRRWGLKPLRRREGPAVQLHLHSPDGEEASLSLFSDIQVFAACT